MIQYTRAIIYFKCCHFNGNDYLKLIFLYVAHHNNMLHAVTICYLDIIPVHPVSGAKQPCIPAPHQDEPLDFEEQTKYCPLPVTPILGTPDGFFSKTNKATILHHLLEDTTPEDLSYPKYALSIQDGMALLHILVNLPLICGEICLEISFKWWPKTLLVLN